MRIAFLVDVTLRSTGVTTQHYEFWTPQLDSKGELTAKELTYASGMARSRAINNQRIADELRTGLDYDAKVVSFQILPRSDELHQSRSAS